ncbi:hypothetical protein GGP85_002031 [Salinibacter ruber]|nr:hypothetical protein [Salinibacter ruber]
MQRSRLGSRPYCQASGPFIFLDPLSFCPVQWCTPHISEISLPCRYVVQKGLVLQSPNRIGTEDPKVASGTHVDHTIGGYGASGRFGGRRDPLPMLPVVLKNAVVARDVEEASPVLGDAPGLGRAVERRMELTREREATLRRSGPRYGIRNGRRILCRRDSRRRSRLGARGTGKSQEAYEETNQSGKFYGLVIHNNRNRQNCVCNLPNRCIM